MSRPTKVPAYRRHQQSGQAVVTLTGVGGRRDIYLGKYGSPESHSQYARVTAEWTGTVFGSPKDQPSSAEGLSITTLILKFWGHDRAEYDHHPIRLEVFVTRTTKESIISRIAVQVGNASPHCIT